MGSQTDLMGIRVPVTIRTEEVMAMWLGHRLIDLIDLTPRELQGTLDLLPGTEAAEVRGIIEAPEIAHVVQGIIEALEVADHEVRVMSAVQGAVHEAQVAFAVPEEADLPVADLQGAVPQEVAEAVEINNPILFNR